MPRLFLALCFALVAAIAQAEPRTLEFDVLREGASIGTHRVTIQEDGNETRVDIAIDLAVRFAFLTVYRYTHRSRETWRAGRLVALDARTDDNGERTRVEARAVDGGLAVGGSGGNYLAPADTVPTSYWNRDKVARDRLLDTQSGKLIEVATVRLDAAGSDAKWRISGDLEADLSYGPSGDWTGLAFVARGARIVYVRRDDAPRLAR